MEISLFLKKWNMGEGRTRVFNQKGEMIFEKYDPDGGTSVDWISAEWAIENGHINDSDKEQYDEDNFRFFKR